MTLSQNPIPLSDWPCQFPRRRPVERFLWYVPILGWIVAAELRGRRQRVLWEAIDERIAMRAEQVWEIWKEAGLEELARVVCDELRKEYGWRAPYFLPEDRLKILTYRLTLDTELIFAVFEMERRLGKKMGSIQSLLLPGEKELSMRVTLREFVALWEK